MSSTSSHNGPQSTPRHNRRGRDMLFLGGLFGLMLFGLIGLAAATGWDETKAQLAKLAPSHIIILLALSLVNYLLRGLRWHMFARRLGLSTTLPQNLRHFLGGFAMSVTPGRVGELIRMRWLRRETGWAIERTAPLVLMDRASDLTAIAIILGVSVSLTTTGITGALPVTLLAIALAVIATRPTLLASLVTYAYKSIGRMPRLFGRIRMAARSMKQFSGTAVMLPALGFGLVGWLAEGYAFHLLLGWLGADIGLAMAMAIFLFSTLAGGLTGAPGGVGGAEAAMVALLMTQGVPLEVALPATAIIRITTLWFAIGIGLAVFPFAERTSLRIQNALENR
ncbi:lysylphosphatidylglycerol synthase transmembrane domain-containing protein [Profundibacter sp.]